MAKFWRWLTIMLASACAIAAPVFSGWGWPVFMCWACATVACHSEIHVLTRQIEEEGGCPFIFMNFYIVFLGGLAGMGLFFGLILSPVPRAPVNITWLLIAATGAIVLGFNRWIRAVDQM